MKPEDDNNHEDIDADLRALFADQRLAVPVGEDAVSSVVTGANRRRRRRTVVLATSGALGVAAVLLAGGLVAGHVLRPGVQTATRPGLATSSYQSTTTTRTAQQAGPEPSVSLPANAPKVLGPTGYGDLRMGMTATQALATKLVNTSVSAVSGCAVYTYIGPTQSRPSAAATAQGNAGSIRVYLSQRVPTGIQEITAPPGVTTPEGIGAGSSVSALRATYANLPVQQGDVQSVPVPGHAGLSYRFTIDKDTVASVGLGLSDQICLRG